MTLEAATLAGIRSWVGTGDADLSARAVEEANLEARYERLGSIEAVALEVLRQRLADWLVDPARVSIDGDADWSVEKNIDVLAKQVAHLERLVGVGDSVLAVGQFTRGGSRR